MKNNALNQIAIDAQRGSTEKMDILLVQCKPRILSIVRTYHFRTYETEDVIQEILIKIYNNILLYNPNKGYYSTFLNRIVTNYCIDIFRKEKRIKQSTFNFEDIENFGCDITAHLEESNIYYNCDKTQIRKLICAMMKCLNKTQKKIVVLRYYEDLSMSEIAKKLDVSTNYVCVSINRAMNKMREHYKAA